MRRFRLRRLAGTAAVATTMAAATVPALAHVDVSADPAMQGGFAKVTEDLESISWTATCPAGATKPGMFDEFEVAAGTLPEDPTMQFKTLRTYSDGTLVRWIEPTPGRGEEPDP